VHLFSRRPPLGRVRFGGRVTFHGLHPPDGLSASARLDTRWSRRDLQAFAHLLAEVAGARRLDLVHFHYAVPFAALVEELRMRLGPNAPRLVGTLHGTDVSIYGRHPRRGRRLAGALASVNALTTVSHSHAAMSSSVFGLPAQPEVIPNFVDETKFRPSGNGWSARRPRIVHVSNFRSVKDPEEVARVFVRLTREADAELWLVGDGELMRPVRRILARAGMQERVRRFGLTSRVQDVLVHTDLLLLTSRTESFGLAALEAAACGVPTVAPRVGGLPEVVADGETGLLFDPGDRDGAVAASVRLVRNARLRAEMGLAATARARGFSRQLVVDRYEALYRRVLEGEPAPEAAAIAGA
jgi:N-acetyl-alpha-D-glucosaminyl L-malate synthase BshA